MDTIRCNYNKKWIWKKILIQRSIIVAFPSGGSYKLSGPAGLESDPVAGSAMKLMHFQFHLHNYRHKILYYRVAELLIILCSKLINVQ